MLSWLPTSPCHGFCNSAPPEKGIWKEHYAVPLVVFWWLLRQYGSGCEIQAVCFNLKRPRVVWQGENWSCCNPFLEWINVMICDWTHVKHVVYIHFSFFHFYINSILFPTLHINPCSSACSKCFLHYFSFISNIDACFAMPFTWFLLTILHMVILKITHVSYYIYDTWTTLVL